jgi:hypothetical protein
MTNQMQQNLERDVLDEPCPRCGSVAVRVGIYGTLTEIPASDVAADPFAGDSPLFDCRDCGFEWGELVADLMR